MIYIYNKYSHIISKSKNLSGIRRRAVKHGVTSVNLERLLDGDGLLSVFFNDDSHTCVFFPSFQVLQKFVRQWRTARGAKLVVDGIDGGFVSSERPRYPSIKNGRTTFDA
jgi:hypothetical protein